MKRTAFVRFRQPSKITGKMVASRHQVRLDQLPKGAEPIMSTLRWIDLPETPEEMQRNCTSAWLDKPWRSSPAVDGGQAGVSLHLSTEPTGNAKDGAGDADQGGHGAEHGGKV